MQREMGSHGGKYSPLFETKKAERKVLYMCYAFTVLVGICSVWAYRVTNSPRRGEDGRWAWFGLLGAELWFGFYWILTQAPRWNPVYRFTFKDRLSHRYEDDLPKVDIYVCTADPTIEPPIMVINTVLSVMAYDYPPEKLAIYLSDDGGSELTFYALLEASKFSRHWIPYCKKFNVEPRSPAAYFVSISNSKISDHVEELVAIKALYAEMEDNVKTATQNGRVPEEARLKHKAFSQWENSNSSRRDHDTILQILINGRDPNAGDIDGFALPTLVYLAREKRPQYHHHFKAGAMNALIRVSSKISNGEIILNLDCDMYSNDSQSIKDALCFFMDEKQNHDIAFVQFPQSFENIGKHDIYSTSLRVITNVEFHGLDGLGGPLYVGSGCFHRRDILYGKKYSEDCKMGWRRTQDEIIAEQTSQELEAAAKPLASCSYEQNTPWGNEVGLIYGCPVEDVITGLSIQCNGWKSIYLNPKRAAFLGTAPTTLSQTLVQHKRWTEGDLQVLISKFSPVWYAQGKISLGLQMGYCVYCFWPVNCLATIYYSIVPSLYLLKGIPLFPQVSSPWLLPFAYVVLAKYVYSLIEFLGAGGTILGWWNEQRMWLYKRTSSYLFAFVDAILKSLSLTELAFTITSKVIDNDVLGRYEKEMMEFGDSSPMFTILATLGLLNLFCFFGMIKKLLSSEGIVMFNGTMFIQIILCGVLVLINLPLYQGLFLRKDKGKMPTSVTIVSFLVAIMACITSYFFN